MPEVYLDKMNSAPYIDNIAETADALKSEPAQHDRNDNIKDFERGTVRFVIGGRNYEASILIGVRENGEKVFHDVIQMDRNYKNGTSYTGSQEAIARDQDVPLNSGDISAAISIPENSGESKPYGEKTIKGRQKLYLPK